MSRHSFVNTAIPTWIPNSTVFDPPYSYSLDASSSVESIVTARAGNGYVAGGTIAPGTYSLINRTTGQALDNLGSTANGANVAQWPLSSSRNQKFVVSYTGGYAKLMCVTGSEYLDSIGNTTVGSSVAQWANSPSYNQQWTIQDIGGGYYIVINRANGLVLDSGGQTANVSSMKFWRWDGHPNLQWAFMVQ